MCLMNSQRLLCSKKAGVNVRIVVVAIVNNQKSRLIMVNMEVLHWRV